MKILTMLLATSFSFHAAAATLEEISPHFSTNAEIVWQVPANEVPKQLWIYRKSPQVFSVLTISNAIVLAGFQQKGFPKPTTNQTVLVADPMEGEPRPPSFLINPEDGVLQYDLGDRWPDSPQDLLADRTAVEYAWDSLARLGLDRTQFVKTNTATRFGVSFPRQIDGVRFLDDVEGFSLQQYGHERKLRDFYVALPNLQRTTNNRTASPQEIIACIRALKTPLAPNSAEVGYFKRVKDVARARKLTITKLTPYYGEGIFGEGPTTNPPERWVTPVAQLEATAALDNGNVPIKLFAPILSSDVQRLLANKPSPAQRRGGPKSSRRASSPSGAGW